MSGGAIPALLGTVGLITIIFIVKGVCFSVKKGSEKVKEITHNLDNELEKITELLKRTTYSLEPEVGKVESISFHLDKADERLFYIIPPSYLPKLKKQYENIIQDIKNNADTSVSYGYDYAVRQFFIGNELIFSWNK